MARPGCRGGPDTPPCFPVAAPPSARAVRGCVSDRRSGASAMSGEFPMILTEVSAPPSAAVPVRAFAEHLRLGSGFADDGSQDAVLELYLRAAMAAIEARLGPGAAGARLRLDGDALARGREPGAAGRRRCASVASVTLVEADGGETAVDPETWSVLRDSQRPRLVGRFGRSLPRIPRSGHAEIRFTRRVRRDLGRGAGRPAAGGVPAGGAFLREPRATAAPSAGSMPFGVLVLIEAYRATRIGGGGRDRAGAAAAAAGARGARDACRTGRAASPSPGCRSGRSGPT